MGLFDKIQSKLELYRLEQRYTRRTKRTNFVSGAEYVDGEYIYPNSTHSSEANSPVSLSKNSTGNREFWRAPTGSGPDNLRSPTSPTSMEFGFGGQQSQSHSQSQVQGQQGQTSWGGSASGPVSGSSWGSGPESWERR